MQEDLFADRTAESGDVPFYKDRNLAVNPIRTYPASCLRSTGALQLPEGW